MKGFPEFNSSILSNVEKIDRFTSGILTSSDDGVQKISELYVQKIQYLFCNRWIGFEQYVNVKCNSWVVNPDFIGQLLKEISQSKSQDEIVGITIQYLSVWGQEAVLDVMGAVCYLEALTSQMDGENNEIIEQVRKDLQLYVGYLNRVELKRNLIFDHESCPGDRMYLAQPIFNQCPELVRWSINMLDIALISRATIIRDWSESSTIDEYILKLSLAMSGVFEECAKVSAYIACELGVPTLYFSNLK